MSSPLFGRESSQPQMNNPMSMMQQIRQLASSLNGQDPQAVAMNLAKQRGLSNDQVQAMVKQAQEIASNLGLR